MKKLRVRYARGDHSWEVQVVGEEVAAGSGVYHLHAWRYTDSAQEAWQICRDIITSGGQYWLFMDVQARV